jgi:hypothetical protein
MSSRKSSRKKAQAKGPGGGEPSPTLRKTLFILEVVLGGLVALVSGAALLEVGGKPPPKLLGVDVNLLGLAAGLALAAHGLLALFQRPAPPAGEGAAPPKRWRLLPPRGWLVVTLVALLLLMVNLAPLESKAIPVAGRGEVVLSRGGFPWPATVSVRPGKGQMPEGARIRLLSRVKPFAGTYELVFPGPGAVTFADGSRVLVDRTGVLLNVGTGVLILLVLAVLVRWRMRPRRQGP